jgi:hypothetical protein
MAGQHEELLRGPGRAEPSEPRGLIAPLGKPVCVVASLAKKTLDRALSRWLLWISLMSEQLRQEAPQ